jgi:hypothetical protein
VNPKPVKEKNVSKELQTQTAKAPDLVPVRADPNPYELATTGAAAAEKHKIEAAMTIAKRFPRDEMAAYESIQKAVKRPNFAEEAMYTFPRAGQDIEGPSVVLAREMARCWGNIRFGVDVIRDDEDTRLIRGWAWDLETNTYTQGEDDFKKLIFRKKDGWIKPDERDLRELTNRRAAFLVRNCLLQLMPADFVDDACKQSKATLVQGAKADPDATLKKLVTAFGSIGVNTTMLADWLAKRRGMESAKIGDSTAEDIAALRTVYKSICDGNSKIGEHFGKAEAKPEQAGNGAPKAGEATVKDSPKKAPAPGEPPTEPSTGPLLL